MTQDDIIGMMREACDAGTVDAWHNDFWTITQEELERFAALVAAAEREVCAIAGGAAADAGLNVAAAIRARGQE